VPELADRIAVDLLDQVLQGENLPRTDPGALRFRRVVVRDASRTSARATFAVGDLITVPLTSPPAAAVWEGIPLLARNPTEIDDQIAYLPGLAEDLRARGVHTSMVVPLIARGITLGAATLSRAEHPAPFDEADVRLAGDLASRAALSKSPAPTPAWHPLGASQGRGRAVTRGAISDHVAALSAQTLSRCG
jgi:GAF domain-containing protein